MACPSFPRSAWERTAGPLRGEGPAASGASALCASRVLSRCRKFAVRDAERRGSAFPRGAWERGCLSLPRKVEAMHTLILLGLVALVPAPAPAAEDAVEARM